MTTAVDNQPSIRVIEPAIRTWRYWTPPMLELASIRADGGHLETAADLCEFLLADDRVKGTLDARADALFGLPVSFEEGLGRKAKQAIRALEAEEDWWVAFPEATCKQLFAWGILLGVALAQVLWIERNGRLTPYLDVKHPRNLRFDYNTRSWLLRTANQGEVTITPGDGWFLYTPYGDSRPWSHGAFRSLSTYILAKSEAISGWAAYCERHGLGILQLEGFEGTKDEREAATEKLSQMGRRACFVGASGSDGKSGQKLTIVEAVASTWQAFKAIIDSADNAAAVSILGQNLTTDVSQGSQAAATVHADVKISKTRSDGETWSTQVHDQILEVWAELNWGRRSIAPWPVYEAEPQGDRQARATTLQLFAQAVNVMTQAQIPIDLAALAAEFGVPMLPPPPPPAPAPAPAPAAPVGSPAV